VKGQYQLVVGAQGWRTLKRKVKAITRKTAPLPLSERITRLKTVQRGWLYYFRLASMWGELRDVDGWVRNRLRYCIWKDWKKPERKRKILIRLGVDQDHAYAWSRTRKGGWASPKSHPEHHDHPVPLGQTRLRSRARSLPESRSRPQPRLKAGAGLCRCIRDPYVQWCERRTPSP